MTSLFSAPKVPTIQASAQPRVTRMPTETDPEILAASQRTRRAALRRRGRQSTIMSDATQSMVGSSGKSLGA